jgi:hypothetical protein
MTAEEYNAKYGQDTSGLPREMSAEAFRKKYLKADDDEPTVVEAKDFKKTATQIEREQESETLIELRNWLREHGDFVVDEYEFHHQRRWKFDFAIPLLKIAIEYDGAIGYGASHSSRRGILRDMEKGNEAQILGWMFLRVSAPTVRNGTAFDLIQRAIDARAGERHDRKTQKIRP